MATIGMRKPRKATNDGKGSCAAVKIKRKTNGYSLSCWRTSPSSVASFDDTTWYYISQKSEELAFFRPTARDPEVVAVVFDKDGIVKDVQKTASKSPRAIEPVARTTPAPGKELSFIEQLIGNFGKFNTNSAAGK